MAKPTQTAVAEEAHAPGTLSLGMLPDLLGFQLRMAQLATFRDFLETFADLGLTPTLFGALVLVEANPGAKQSELARTLGLDRSTMVSIIDRLEREGWVRRRRAATDRRSNAIELTAAGRRILPEFKRRVAEHEARLTAHLGADEQARLRDLLGRIFPDRR
ncbi:MarR family winged helix-turn-helix transcriptional regulator [Inmirania thermothiophila]|uniref:MarR family transcriptional regulator n=1 Tax=Inmirania thermothiophila TaxID=1750597 RepID=A0A3N1Y052_9GAMM|nr:MarR family transcriptional regulator [Inmirania thermothiophila]ROR32199.1 MarR family transcriptional regulator [Inmirania thermothiophila]